MCVKDSDVITRAMSIMVQYGSARVTIDFSEKDVRRLKLLGRNKRKLKYAVIYLVDHEYTRCANACDDVYDYTFRTTSRRLLEYIWGHKVDRLSVCEECGKGLTEFGVCMDGYCSYVVPTIEEVTEHGEAIASESNRYLVFGNYGHYQNGGALDLYGATCNLDVAKVMCKTAVDIDDLDKAHVLDTEQLAVVYQLDNGKKDRCEEVIELVAKYCSECGSKVTSTGQCVSVNCVE